MSVGKRSTESLELEEDIDYAPKISERLDQIPAPTYQADLQTESKPERHVPEVSTTSDPRLNMVSGREGATNRETNSEMQEVDNPESIQLVHPTSLSSKGLDQRVAAQHLSQKDHSLHSLQAKPQQKVVQPISNYYSTSTYKSMSMKNTTPTKALKSPVKASPTKAFAQNGANVSRETKPFGWSPQKKAEPAQPNRYAKPQASSSVYTSKGATTAVPSSTNGSGYPGKSHPKQTSRWGYDPGNPLRESRMSSVHQEWNNSVKPDSRNSALSTSVQLSTKQVIAHLYESKGLSLKDYTLPRLAEYFKEMNNDNLCRSVH